MAVQLKPDIHWGETTAAKRVTIGYRKSAICLAKFMLVKNMLRHFRDNTLFEQRLNEAGARDQFIELIQFAHEKGLDWYFTDTPDLRCGRKEVDALRASSVCFGVWFKNLNEIRIRDGHVYGLQKTKMPITPGDFSKLKKHIKRFVEDNPTNRSRTAFFPDQYLTPDQEINKSDPLDASINRMIKTMLGTVANSNGQQAVVTIKNKGSSLTQKKAEELLQKLFNDQDGLCAITNIRLELGPKPNKLVDISLV